MKSVIVAWVNKGKQHEFENHVPLLFLGKRNQSLGYANGIDVVFLSGLDLLDRQYTGQLEETGFNLIDASGLYAGFDQAYEQLNRFGNYEKRCFLRWLVLEKLYANTPIIHYDGDIVFNEDPEKITALFNGLTFCLQGCPAILSISDPAWYEQYRMQLDLFYRDMEGYSKQAWEERTGWETTKFTKWAGERHREIVSSDQDLISHLIHTDRIIQENIGVVKKRAQGYFLMQNPLLVNEHQDAESLSYRRINGIDFINNHRVLVWHMQSDFIFYLSLFLYRQKFSPKRGRLLFWENKRSKVMMFIYKVISKITQQHQRSYIYNHFFSRSDFSHVFTPKTWWIPRIFK